MSERKTDPMRVAFETGEGVMIGGKADDARPITYVMAPEDREVAKRIASRACEEAKARQGVELDWWLVYMDLLTWPCNIERLNLLGLLMSGPMDFQHDVVGMGVNIDRANARNSNSFFRPQFVERKQ